MNKRRTVAIYVSGALIVASGIIYLLVHHGEAVREGLSGSRTAILHVSGIQDGIPREVTGQLLQKTAFWLCYNEEAEQADWTAYILTREMVESGTEERTENFRQDTTVVTGSASLADYRGSGYDRGHLVPAADMGWSHQSMSESFLMSNMSPQVPGFNRGVWRRLEEQVRQWAVRNDSLYIITGPVNRSVSRTIGADSVGIPEYYFKIVVDISWPDYKAIGFLIRNEPSNRDIFDFAVSIDSIESILSVDFFPGQDPEDIAFIESHFDPQEWK
jgi:endonuclease G